MLTLQPSSTCGPQIALFCAVGGSSQCDPIHTATKHLRSHFAGSGVTFCRFRNYILQVQGSHFAGLANQQSSTGAHLGPQGSSGCFCTIKRDGWQCSGCGGEQEVASPHLPLEL